MVSQSTHLIAKAVGRYIELKADGRLDADHPEVAGAIEAVLARAYLAR